MRLVGLSSLLLLAMSAGGAAAQGLGGFDLGAITSALTDGLASLYSFPQLGLLGGSGDILGKFPEIDVAAVVSSVLGPLKDEIQIKSKKSDVDDLYAAYLQLDNKICDYQVIKGDKTYAECTGKSMVITFRGGDCEVDSATETVTCTKPYATMFVEPPSCQHVFTESSLFCDRECKIEVELGMTKTNVIKAPEVVLRKSKDWSLVPDIVAS
ncbi:unnamed protein product [Pedinophyceae sp. YPF-701]|nr:unnamed protein product [Pedinophyceae sp. YPF-701]